MRLLKAAAACLSRLRTQVRGIPGLTQAPAISQQLPSLYGPRD